MMLTRFVRIQLIIFTIAGLVGLFFMAFKYIQVQSFVGLGRMDVTLELPEAGGLYRFSNVTYRGVEVGKVGEVELTRNGVKATMSLNSSAKIPADLEASVRSVSAVGEQYVDLRPRTDSPPYLHDGSVIHAGPSAIPQPVGPVLDQASALVGTIPKKSCTICSTSRSTRSTAPNMTYSLCSTRPQKSSGTLMPSATGRAR